MIKKQQEANQSSSKTARDACTESVHPITLDRHVSHPRRERCKYAGEVIQMDACQKDWFQDGSKYQLHVAVDDATGAITGLFLADQDTLNGYYHVFYQTLLRYGIPARFLTDKRTVFEYKRKDSPVDGEDPLTQFSRACAILGTEVKTTSVPQGKGRVERMNQTLQDRLPKEFRRHNIKTAEQANEFLLEYMDKFNSQFALQLSDSLSVFEEAPDTDTIYQILSVQASRVIDQGHCIKYKNNYYLPLDEEGKDVYLNPKTKVTVIETFDSKRLMMAGDQLYRIRMIEDHASWSASFDPAEEKPKSVKEKWKPAPNHPWRQYRNTNNRDRISGR